MHISTLISRVLEVCPEPTTMLAGATVACIAALPVLVLTGLIAVAALVALMSSDFRQWVHAREVLGDLLNALVALLRGRKQ